MTGFIFLECLFILLARATDVSLGTLRIMMVVQGRRKTAFVIGFFEMLIWISIILHVITRLNSPFHIISYAFGFGLGNYIGIGIEKKLALGEQVLRIFTRHEDLATLLRDRGHYVTVFEGYGREGKIFLLYIKIKRRNSIATLELAREVDPKLFYIIENIAQSSRITSEEIFGHAGWSSFIKK